MFTPRSTNGRPVVEDRLEAAHTMFGRLRNRRATLIRSGFNGDDLPSETALMCFALLGDHEREQVGAQLASSWQTLQAKGLAHGALETTPTGDMRLLAHILPLAGAVNDLWDRLQEAARTADEPPPDTLHCPSRVHGQWGQPARVHFSVRAAAHLLIVPDAVFGMLPALVAPSPTEEVCVGSFTIPVDDGAVTITGILNSGQSFRHRVLVAVGEVA